MLQIVIGDKNLSSWSMRPWLVLRSSGLPFRERRVLLDRPNTKRLLRQVSPTGRVPVLIHGKIKVWDSLAICEYLHELAPDQNLWPKSATDRALARSYVAEMHSGFQALRNQLSMEIQLRRKITHLMPDTVQDIKRILVLWRAALKRSGGPYLFGAFGIVDAFYAPVVMRFASYAVDVRDPLINQYRKTMQKNPAVREWVAEAKKEKPLYLRF